MGFLDTLLGKTGEDKDAQRLAAEAGGMYDKISAPSLEAPVYERYRDMGSYTPTSVNAATVNAGADTQFNNIDPSLAGDTAMAGVAADPRLQDSQFAALAALEEISKGGGLTAQDKADLNRVQSEAAQQDRGRRDAILQNAAARGMSGGGNELLAQLSSSQAATDRANQSGLDIAGLAQQRALDAIMQSGNMAGNMRSQDFGEQSDIAKAKDAIAQFNAGMSSTANQFNASNALQNAQFNRGMGFDASRTNADLRQQAGMFNAGNATDAAKYGAMNRQDVANQNTGVSNLQKDAKNATAQQSFGNAVDLAGAKAAAKTGQAGVAQNVADRKVQGAGNVFGSLVGLGTTVGKKVFGG